MNSISKSRLKRRLSFTLRRSGSSSRCRRSNLLIRNFFDKVDVISNAKGSGPGEVFIPTYRKTRETGDLL